MKCVIVSGGRAPSKELFMKEIEDADLLIAADRGAECFFYNNVHPHLLVGDFDSIRNEVLSDLSFLPKLKFQREKDFTDSEIAFNKAIEMGADEIILLGCTGTRLDHVFANMGLLKKAIDKQKKAEIKDDNNRIFLCNKPLSIQGKPCDTISFQAFGQDVTNFSILGAKYPLENYKLSFGDGRTVSNEFLNEEIEIRFSSGVVIVMLSSD